MRKLPTIGLISAAAALSFFCATAVQNDAPAGQNAPIIATTASR